MLLPPRFLGLGSKALAPFVSSYKLARAEGIQSHRSFCPSGGCQNYGPFLSTLNIRFRIIVGIQKGTITLTTTQVNTATPVRPRGLVYGVRLSR